MSPGAASVFVIDDDAAMRDALRNLLRSTGNEVETFASIEAFLEYDRPDTPCCLILDVRLPGASGLEFQRQATARGHAPPIIFVTAHGDVPMSVAAMKAGAIEFLMKPFRSQELLDAVYRGLKADRAAREDRLQRAELLSRHAQLSEREREVMAYVVAGHLNKQIADRLHLSEVTVKAHRGSAMRKMGAHSLPELVRLADRLGSNLKG